nr:hypothetical protein [Tanacetum cinerariifolium]
MLGNQTEKNAGPQDTNGNAGTQDNIDVGKEVSDQHYIVLPLWYSISSTYKSSDDKPADDKPKDDNVCACSSFEVTPKLSHLQAVKRIFRKSTTRGCQFLGRRLISWQCKKHTIVATSTTEA